MKKQFLTFCFSLLLASAFAQPLANHLYLGGRVSFSDQTTERIVGNTVTTSSSSSYNFSPAIGYTLTDNWMLGVRLGIGGSDNGNSTSSNFDANLFGRYSLPIAERFYFIPEIQIGTGTSSTDNNAGVRTSETSYFGIGVLPGLAFFPTTHWSIELNAGFIGYQTVTTKNVDNLIQPNETTNDGFIFDVNGITVGVGIYYYLIL